MLRDISILVSISLIISMGFFCGEPTKPDFTPPALVFGLYKDAAGTVAFSANEYFTVGDSVFLTVRTDRNQDVIYAEVKVRNSQGTVIDSLKNITILPTDTVIQLGSYMFSVVDTLTLITNIGADDKTYSDSIQIIVHGAAPIILNNGNIIATGTVVEDSSLVLSVEVTGTAPLTYTWFKNTVVIPNQENSSLAFLSLLSSDAGSYYCTVENAWGKDTSLPYILSFTNRAPVWSSDTIAIAAEENTETSVDLSLYCTDPNGDSIIYTLSDSLFSNDKIEGSMYTFTPSFDDGGYHTVIITATDGALYADVVVAITVANVNRPPVWSVDSIAVTIPEDSVVNIILNNYCSDADNDPILYAIDSSALLTDSITSNNVYTYYAGFNANGTYTVRIKAKDATDSAFITIYFTVTDKNRAPCFLPDKPRAAYQIDENATLEIEFAAEDPDSDNLTYSIIGTNLPRPDSINFNTATGLITWNSITNDGGTYIFTLQVTDSSLFDTATVTIGIGNVNLPPVITIAAYQNGNSIALASGDLVEISEGETVICSLTVTDINIADTIFTITSAGLPDSARFTVTGNNTAEFIYVPGYDVSSLTSNTSWPGITFFADDGNDTLHTSSFTFSITVNNSNRKPVAVDDIASTAEETAVKIAALLNDSDPDGDAISIISLIGTPSNGTAATDNDTITYTPDNNFNGIDTINYIIQDAAGLKDSAKVSVTVSGTNDKPVITGQELIATDEDVNLTLTINLFTIVDSDDDTFTIEALAGDNYSVLADNKTVSPAPDFFTNTSEYLDVSVRVSDGKIYSDIFTAKVTVNAVNDAPDFMITSDNVIVPTDTGAVSIPDFAINITPGAANETDQTVTFHVTSTNTALYAAGNTPQLSPTGTLTFTVLNGAEGVDNISVYLQDSESENNQSATKQFSIRVNIDNHPPTIDDFTSSVEINEGQTEVVLPQFSDVDNTNPYLSETIDPSLTWIAIDSTLNSITISPPYTVVANGTPDSTCIVKFTIVDEIDPAITVNHLVSIQVNNVNRAPQITSQPDPKDTVGLHHSYEAPFAFSDEDGDNVSVTVTPATIGLVYDSTNDKITWFPDRTLFTVGQKINAKVVIDDGFGGKDSVEWEIYVKTHVWEIVGVFDTIQSLAAINENDIFVHKKEIHPELGIDSVLAVVEKYSNGSPTGIRFTYNITNRPSGGYTINNGIQLFNETIYAHLYQNFMGSIVNKYYILTANPTSIDSVGTIQWAAIGYTFTHSRHLDKLFYAEGNDISSTIYDPEGYTVNTNSLGQPFTMDASRNGVCVFLCSTHGVMRKIGTSIVPNWENVHNGTTFFKVVIASDNGDIVYFIDNSRLLCKSLNALNSGTITITELSNYIDLGDIDFVNDSTGWVTNQSGIVKFSNDYFTNSSTEIFPGNAIIREVIISEDRDAVFAISENNEVFRY